MKPNHYDTLRVARDAQDAEIQLAFRTALELAYRQQPPDADRLAAIRNAHRILSDAELRREHDASLPPPRAVAPQMASAESTADIDTNGKSPLIKWTAVALIFVVIVAWWKTRKSPPPATPASVAAATVAADSPSGPVPASNTSPSAERQLTASEAFAKLGPSVGRMHVYSASGQLTGTGSAVAIGTSTIITNCHVLVGGVRAELHIAGQRLATQLQIADQELDLCRMQVAGLLRPVQIGSVSDVHNNLTVFAIGAPGGGPVIITEGVVTTLHGIAAGNVIQTTAAVSPGSSGGGLFTTNGKLVGIVTFQQRGLEQRNYAIPVDWINRMETREGSGQADEVIPPVYYN